ncbi:ATPase, T2SS/T4P/T4SS family [Bacillus sp. JJ1122]|uniref:ATPase, T2SS/T4P/T4SS family n=1 Tax=Bacillus sp. JJ1122 TaxID=3122951 RepID=UPI003F68A104
MEQLAENVLKDALRSGASDIHIIPRERDTLIKFRLGNQLLPRFTLEQADCDRLISHFKFTASMDIGEKRRPQSGAYTYQYLDTKIGLRISTLPAYKNESMVIRLLPQQNQIPSFQISLFPETSKKLISLLKHAHGLIIFTGPTS